MCLVFVVISALFVGCSWGQVEDDIFDKCKIESRIRCGIDKVCVPADLCRDDGSNWNNEPVLDMRNEFDVCGPTTKCCHINNLILQKNSSRKYDFHLPYLGSFSPKSFGVGKSIHLEGFMLPKLPASFFSQLFYIRLQSGKDFWPIPTIAFEFTNSYITYHYTADGSSQRKALNQNLPREKSFNMDIVRGRTSYKVYVNKQLVAEIPMLLNERIMDTLYVNGDIRLRDVVIENFSPKADTEMGYYLFENIADVKEGVSFIVTGYIKLTWEQLAINLYTPDYKIPLHFNMRQKSGTVLYSSSSRGIVSKGTVLWDEVLEGTLPTTLRAGSKFTCQILVTEKCYMIAINGRHAFEFHHRLPYRSVTRIDANTDVDNAVLRRTEGSRYPEPLCESDVEEIWVATD